MLGRCTGRFGRATVFSGGLVGLSAAGLAGLLAGEASLTGLGAAASCEGSALAAGLAGGGDATSRDGSGLPGAFAAGFSAGRLIAGAFAAGASFGTGTGVIGPLAAGGGGGGTGAVATGGLCAQAALAPNTSAVRPTKNPASLGLLITYGSPMRGAA